MHATFPLNSKKRIMQDIFLKTKNIKTTQIKQNFEI